MVKDHALFKKGTPLIKLDQEQFRIKLAAAEAEF